ncbi:hypothetical protein [Massilia yuzhufengensis]|uniref:Universal stress protein family protein n=1 Tax=Massilia yuzhufengensis TaxID=1164594 RepID=A0A1I1QIT6_9BURK|nr:hypothetical protein [Massilia yuzhufengensis]SFD21979.1 hypothetical protein SAMN05216204_11954 [Massilia yuzhufengensis]
MSETLSPRAPRRAGLAAALAVPAGPSRPWWHAFHHLALARTLLRAPRQPVLLLRATAQRPYRRALFALPAGPHAAALLRQALHTLPQAHFTVLAACRVGGEGSMRAAGVGAETLDACRRSAERATRARVRAVVAQAGGAGHRLSVVLARLPVAAAIGAHAVRAAPDLLVMEAAPTSWWGRWCWLARVRAAMAATDCDLLLA